MEEVSEEDLQRDPARALRASASGPVFLTESGRVTHVLVSFEEYLRLGGEPDAIVSGGAAKS